MAKKMLIVESPAKAKTISKYLDGEFIVKSSYGHIRDLDKGNKGIDKENKFEPNYVVSPEKTKVVKELKAAAKKVSEVWLATDEDREGEAIAWHLCEVLGLDEKTTKRIVFREITKSAIQNAVKEPRTVDINLVNAQQARRILDRLVGFELSEILWRKVKNKLSAGRVQSVAVKLIIEREKEIIDFKTTPYYKVYAYFTVKDKNGKATTLKAELKSNLDTLEDAEKFLEQSKGATYTIDDIVVKPSKRKPAPPFTTSTLQQEASRKLGFSVNRTMSTAQRLYEQGHITYMRTDSKSLSKQAVAAIASEIEEKYGEEYLQIRDYKGKNAKGAQEAHEAIRPTNASNIKPDLEDDQLRLYQLIWRRTVASQMSDAKLENTTVNIGISTIKDANYTAKGQVIVFDGFLKLYIAGKDEDEEEDDSGLLPPLSQGQVLENQYVQSVQKFTRPPSRYTEASLVKKLEELGIGRPSTYAPTITKIMDPARGYVEKESREGTPRDYNVLTLKNDQVSTVVETENTGSTSKRLYGKDIGIVVTDFLSEHFDAIMNYTFTANVEERLDQIAEGKIEWKDMLVDFYDPFHETVERTLAEAERAKGRRDLGVDEKTGHTILVQMARYGPVAQIGTLEEVGEEGKPKFASLKPGQSIATISLDEVMELFKLPYTLGDYLDKEVEVAQGRFGPYIKFDEKFISLAKGEDPLTITMERAQELIDERIKQDMPIGQHDGMPITKGIGRFGPFLKWNDWFINIPKRYDHENLSDAEIKELIEAKKEKEANRFVKQWPDLKLAIENGRWGPFIRFKKKSIKLPKIDDKRMTSEQAAELELEEIKKLVEEELPGSFKEKKKKAPAKKKAAAKKKPAAKKKTTTKKK